jgi:hypothetical protein
MQTLIFNTSEKVVYLKPEFDTTNIIMEWENVPTVRVDVHYYEVMQKKDGVTSLPVFRAPIANTNMVIIKND